MTYEPYEKGGMKITVSNPSKPRLAGRDCVTMFSRPVPSGQRPEGYETAVEIINEKSTRILNKRDGVVYQVVINTLSDDNNRDQQRVHPHGQGWQDHGRHARDLHQAQEVVPRAADRCASRRPTGHRRPFCVLSPVTAPAVRSAFMADARNGAQPVPARIRGGRAQRESGVRVLGPDALAAAERQRIEEQVQFVHQAVCEQRAHQLTAAVRENRPYPGCAFRLRTASAALSRMMVVCHGRSASAT